VSLSAGMLNHLCLSESLMNWVFSSSNVSAAGAPAIRVWVSVPEIIVNVPSESCRWDA
jgi:hypothetical protein